MAKLSRISTSFFGAVSNSYAGTVKSLSPILGSCRQFIPTAPCMVSAASHHNGSCSFLKTATKLTTCHHSFLNTRLKTPMDFSTFTPVLNSSPIMTKLSSNLPSLHSLCAIQTRSLATSPEATIKTKVRGIQKDISPLTTRRIVKRKKSKDSPPRDQEVFEVTAYATAEEYDLDTLRSHLTQQGLYEIVPLPDDVLDALHVEARYRVDDEPRKIFFFREGSVVFWNIPAIEREAVLRFLKRHQSGAYNPRLVELEYERVEFAYSQNLSLHVAFLTLCNRNTTQLVGDEIQFEKRDKGADDHKLEKYAFSNALSLSVKLAIWEASLARYVDSIESVLQDLKSGKKIRFSEAEVLRKSGELFTLRHLINLSSDLLDTPDFYWDRDHLEHLYSRTLNYLNITRRTKVMNDKLTHCCELTELLRDHLKDKHHTRLEWMIILLIMLEVAFEILHTFERRQGK